MFHDLLYKNHCILWHFSFCNSLLYVIAAFETSKFKCNSVFIGQKSSNLKSCLAWLNLPIKVIVYSKRDSGWHNYTFYILYYIMGLLDFHRTHANISYSSFLITSAFCLQLMLNPCQCIQCPDSELWPLYVYNGVSVT
jgi:hypothetical protein